MNIQYKILWIDDDPEYVESARAHVEKIVRDNKMEPVIKIYNEYETYRREEMEKFDVDVFNLYDQIVIDYALSGTTGDKIIKDLRSKDIYTDIVFYSSNYREMSEELRKSEMLDGIFWADRQDVNSTIYNVIKKNLRREFSIANIRGLIMDSTSEFDYICRTTTMALFDSLSEEMQKEVVEKAKTYASQAEQFSNETFSKLKAADGKKFIKEVMTSVDYVMANKDRYALMSMVVESVYADSGFNDSFAEQYASDLIKPRNDLAHSKLYYGACKRKLHISKKLEKHECNRKCDECKSKYGVEQCELIRQKIYEYYQMFEELNSRVCVGTRV